MLFSVLTQIFDSLKLELKLSLIKLERILCDHNHKVKKKVLYWQGDRYEQVSLFYLLLTCKKKKKNPTDMNDSKKHAC